MKTVLFAVLCALICAISQAQMCTPVEQVLSEEAVNLADFVELLDVEFPASCGDFVPLTLLPCRDELDVIEGCCMSDCRGIFAEYSPQCLRDLADTLCESEAGAPAVFILDRVASRCDEDYSMLMCENEEISDPDVSNDAVGSLPEIDLDDLDELDDAISELDDLEDDEDGDN